MRRLPILLAVGALLLAGSSLAVARQATPAATPSVLPATPVGEPLGWVLGVLNGGAGALTPADVTARFAPAFLAAIPPAQLVGFVQQFAALGPFAFQGFTRPPPPPKPTPSSRAPAAPRSSCRSRSRRRPPTASPA